MLWRASLLTGYWLILGRGFKGSVWTLMCSGLIFLISVGDFATKKVVIDSVEADDQLLPESALVPSRAKQINVKESLNSPGWLLWWLLSNSRIIIPFQKKAISAWYYFKKNYQCNIWKGTEELRRKECVSLKGSKQKGIRSQTGISCESH